MILIQIRQFLKIALVVVALLTGLVAPVMANGNQSNQDIHQPATLISPEPSFEIGVYPKPNESPKRIGFGLGGDRVTIFEQVGSNEGKTWDYVQFETKQPEGWVQDEFVALQKGDRYTQRAYPSTPISNSSQNSYPQKPYQSQQQAQFPKQAYQGEQTSQTLKQSGSELQNKLSQAKEKLTQGFKKALNSLKS